MKASALHILQGLEEIPSYALDDRELWTVKTVKEALVDAFRLLRSTAGRVGPAAMRGYWPEFQNNADDYADERTKVSPYHTRMTVTRMEMVLTGWRDDDGKDHEGWLRGPLGEAPELRSKLEAWVFAELRGEAAKELCLRKKWPLATFKRHRDRAAGVIAIRLNTLGFQVWG